PSGDGVKQKSGGRWSGYCGSWPQTPLAWQTRPEQHVAPVQLPPICTHGAPASGGGASLCVQYGGGVGGLVAWNGRQKAGRDGSFAAWLVAVVTSTAAIQICGCWHAGSNGWWCDAIVFS